MSWGLSLSVRDLMIGGWGLRVQDDGAEGFWRELVETEFFFFGPSRGKWVGKKVEVEQKVEGEHGLGRGLLWSHKVQDDGAKGFWGAAWERKKFFFLLSRGKWVVKRV
jgi:hypothetical protein